MRTERARSALLSAALLLSAACDRESRRPSESTGHEPEPPPPSLEIVDPLALATPLDPDHEKWWMEKAARMLTGREIAADDPAWAGLTRQQFVDRLIAAPGFADTTLAFSLYFLGFKQGAIRDSQGAVRLSTLRFPHAVAAARAVAEGGDFLQLLRLEQPMYVSPLRRAQLPGERPQPPQPEPPQPEIRAKLRDLMTTELQRLSAYAADPAFEKEAFCGMLFPDETDGLFDYFFAYGFPDDLQASMRNSAHWLGGIDLWCFLPDQPAIDVKARLAGITDLLPRLFDLAESLLPEVYKPVNLTDVRVIDPAAFGFDPPTTLTQEGFFFTLQNSSTNYNRKRGAYILKRYFCDDLTPIALALPDQHAEDRHASDPGCQSCHYKLDPIAGFFKDRGVVGFDFGTASQIVFDDLATLDKAEYQRPWRAPAGSGRTWEIGYIRSLDEPALNSYGESLADLYRIIEQAPETRQCVVRRVFEHLVGEEQVIDPGYLDFLTRKFEERARQSSSAAYKETVARVVLGRTFGEQDLVSSECYDRAPGTDAGLAPPCSVNFLLQRHCVMCHSASAAAGGLDLTTWVELEGGDRSFPHRKGGRQLTKAETFQSLYDRLSSSDRARRMPLGKHMPAHDRETLFLWADDMLNGSGGR